MGPLPQDQGKEVGRVTTQYVIPNTSYLNQSDLCCSSFVVNTYLLIETTFFIIKCGLCSEVLLQANQREGFQVQEVFCPTLPTYIILSGVGQLG